MKIQNLKNSPRVPFNLEGYILHSEKPVELVHLLLKPGDALEKHKNPFDVIFFVIEGSGILAINGDNLNIHSNDVIKVTSDKLRAWENNSTQDLKLLVIKLI
ncbi:MAG: hypothetical protein A2X13_10855 [Bacteroidetes bacterium GWC2_33_15]|nr:MAG: hypothetical protein A2X10_11355 [Bacteroidetes bacterium GWA2_33_15]OFX52545.1 MAG: hypothetical protein A2X13_10855 [Bacteroidetes bacterium GWC2_33_15]OFX63890.1 MAG: hypothetical protein A2X15_03200 [Bacteroidetes bacterium GWB2_32_14]OFX70843.1 MAG: hypothetical protein A2X14_00390 [Bacteroidetes bacterium GWD2_33_33]HAN19972.1 hypothetical protein [Bacteroidales bacterium]